MAPLHFLVDLFFNFVERDVARAFDHHLDVVLPGLLGEFAEDLQFGELRFVAGVGDAAGTQAVAKRKTHVVLLENLADLLDVFVEEILFFVVLHPVGHQRAAAADDAGDALANKRNMFAQDAGMDGHVVDALLGLLFDHFEHEVEGEIFRAGGRGKSLHRRARCRRARAKRR